jgi:hypothetical protein
VLGVCVGCGIATFAIVGHRGRADDSHNTADPPATAAEVADLRAEVAQLRQLSANRPWEGPSMFALAARAAEAAKGAGQAAQGGGAAARHDEPVSIDKAQEGARRSRELQETRFRALEEEMRTQPRDDTWAAATEDSLRKALTQPEVSGYKLNTVRCGKTLCRLDISETPTAVPGAIPMVLGPAVPDLPSALYLTNKDQNGRPNTIAFFARSGFEFPTPSKQNLAQGSGP